MPKSDPPAVELLRKWIAGQKCTQTVFADRLGVSDVSVSNILRQRNRPTLELRYAIQAATGGAVKVSAWLTRAERGLGLDAS